MPPKREKLSILQCSDTVQRIRDIFAGKEMLPVSVWEINTKRTKITRKLPFVEGKEVGLLSINNLDGFIEITATPTDIDQESDTFIFDRFGRVIRLATRGQSLVSTDQLQTYISEFCPKKKDQTAPSASVR